VRVLHLNEVLGFVGGAEQYLHSVATELRNRGHENFLGYRRLDDGTAKCFSSPFVHSQPIEPTERFIEFFIRDKSPDLVFVHRWGDIKQFTTTQQTIPTVRFVHDHQLYCIREHKFFYLSGKNCGHPLGNRCYLCLPFSKDFGPKNLHQWPLAIRRKVEELAQVKSFSLLMVASHYMKKQLLLNGFSSEHIEVLPLFAKLPRQCADFSKSDPKHVLYIGQIHRGKGLDLLLQSLPSLRTPYALRIAGRGNWEDHCKKLAVRLGVSSNVHFLGWQSPEAISSLLNQCTLVVMPSRWAEPFGLVGLEAMAHSRPVVAFAVGGIPEWLQDGQTGFLAQPEDAHDLAKQINRLLTDPDLSEKLGRQGRARVQCDFSPEKHLLILERTFNRLIQAGQDKFAACEMG